MIRQMVNVFSIPELRKKLGFTLLAILIYRLGSYMPIPGTSPAFLSDFISRAGSLDPSTGYLGLISAITAGSFGPFLFCLGVMPYISASIVIQLLTTVVPTLEKLAKEGEVGRKKINEYTRYLTVLLCLIQGGAIVFNRMGWADPAVPTGLYLLVAMCAITTGTVFLMWLGELIDEFGIGSGASLIIMAGIVDKMPSVVLYLRDNASWSLTESAGGSISAGTVILIIAMFIFVVLGTVMITQGQRRIPIQQAKHVRGRRVYGSSQRNYLPLRVNHAGVIPVIFASSLLYIPSALVKQITVWLPNSVFWLQIESAFQYGQVLYILAYVALIFVFCYFWTAIQFKPNEMAENLRDYGSFIPGMRPGRRTAEYLERVMNRITYIGSAFLAAIAILPMLVSQGTGIGSMMASFLGGTSLLIIVSVALDLIQRIESHLIMRHYEGFLASGRVRGRLS